MESASESTARIDIPSEDGRIDHALGDLTAKIDAWSAAMNDALSALRAASQQAARKPQQTAAASNVAGAPQTKQDRTDATAPSEKVQPAGRSGIGSRFKRLVSGTDSEPSPPSPPKKGIVIPEPDAPPEPTDEFDEDEALLATLDPKVAKAIRIKRRLLHGKKSVKELLDEQ